MNNIYEEIINQMVATDQGKQDLFLLCSAIANQVEEAESEEEKEKSQEIARYLLWSVCLAYRRQMKFFRSLIRILKPVSKKRKEKEEYVNGQ